MSTGPSASPTTSRGAVVIVFHGGKNRPGVVLDTTAHGRLYVLTGTRTDLSQFELPCKCVEPADRYGKAMRIRERTWFNGHRMRVAMPRPEAVRATGGTCPPGLLAKLDEFAGRVKPAPQPTPPAAHPSPPVQQKKQ